MLWILHCDEAIINRDNYGEVMTFALPISGEKKQKKETIAEKGRDKLFRVYYEALCKNLCTQKNPESGKNAVNQGS